MYQFINPYNFVPLGDAGLAVKDKGEVYRGDVQKELLSGWLNVEMILNTPLIIPDGAHPKYYDLENRKYVKSRADVKNPKKLHLEYDFLRMYCLEAGKKEYAVPGSELRGLVRNAYEAVTNSCVPFLLDDKPMSQRVPLYGALNRRGLLGYDKNEKKWILYKTKKELEEVVVVPVYEIDGSYYVESLNNVRKNVDNQKKDDEGNFKYPIMEHLDDIERKIPLKWKPENGKSKNVQYGAVFVKNRENNKKWDIKVHDTCVKTKVDKKLVRHLFIKADGSIVTEKPAELIRGKGFIQYNVPVDLSKIYHVAYLLQEAAVHEWSESTARGDENQATRQDYTYAEAYKKLRSAIVRDGAESYKKTDNGKKRVNNQPNSFCNFALEEALEKACEDPAQLVPVYYFVVNTHEGKELVYMSGSAAGRIAQRRKWKEIMHDHAPCTDKLCPACLLFGTVADGGMKGHVRFTDAFMENVESSNRSRHTLQILSSPRTTAFEFYLKKPVENATYWNYDFYGVTETDNSDGSESSHTNYYHLDRAMPRGRKMYWHHPLSPDDNNKSNLNSTVQSIDAGRFSFQVFFDQITKEQLTDLLWTITLGDNRMDSRLQHKLGHAKPLGYGSVKLLVTGGTIRTFCKAGNGSFCFKTCDLADAGINVEDIKPTFNRDSLAVKSFLAMCNVDAVGENQVDYPRVRRPEVEGNQVKKVFPIYEWFSENRTNSKNLTVLPEPTDRKLFLTGGGRQRGGQTSDKNQITVCLTSMKPDQNNPKMKVGYFDGGMVFKIPANIEETKICVTVKNEKDGRKYCDYKGLV